jgi:tripartite-type tricarboxylate transporter receptor subunit TctC
VPTLFEQVKLTDEQARIIDWRARIASLGRVIVAAPNTPPERVNTLRAAFKAAMSDGATLANLQRRRLEPDFAEGAEAKKLVQAAMSTLDEATLKKVRKIVLNTYY